MSRSEGRWAGSAHLLLGVSGVSVGCDSVGVSRHEGSCAGTVHLALAVAFGVLGVCVRGRGVVAAVTAVVGVVFVVGGVVVVLVRVGVVDVFAGVVAFGSVVSSAAGSQNRSIPAPTHRPEHHRCASSAVAVFAAGCGCSCCC